MVINSQPTEESAIVSIFTGEETGQVGDFPQLVCAVFGTPAQGLFLYWVCHYRKGVGHPP